MISKEKLNKYVEVTKEFSELKDTLLQKQLLFDLENKSLLEKLVSTKDKINDLTTSIKEDGLIEFQETHLKKLTGGLGVRIMTELEYDEDKAFNWAKEHNLCLELNKKEFKNISKTQKLDFVVRFEKIIITFPKEIKLEMK